MAIVIESRRKKPETFLGRFPGAVLVDVTSRGEMPWVKFSPFFPHGGIPVPMSPGRFAHSVEGIRQGLKVFETEGVDLSKFEVKTMNGLKRSVRTRGRVLGHRAGVPNPALLGYREARYKIYLPAYRWVLDNCLQTELQRLRELAATATVVLLDYETNSEVENLKSPLSHASLIVRYLENHWPEIPEFPA
ncbi:MAG TPA: hypothetical protein PKA34_33045 [Blastocatellia bacterium]|nr:hypothetical protein [Blastocatellia bacterium]HNG34089.1 hypothetical protein [Blastocatellia bacterium]